ncbi:origin recognition complex subunit 1 isoform X1 [Boleophthalmus pectinirostris]|uniref:origin recognition complex subunit 1 isoform X1 n=1 Tax=Boleophthalmus pectinirostris TaxID=150288 RepID=UPI002430D576|nr:origin recognition complex subunit 1 isoform X1 [Boleophthalmus pectinirostris]
MMKFSSRLRPRRWVEWTGRPLGFDRKLRTHEYGGLSIRVEGLPRVTHVSVGQHILIEGHDEDHPYVAKVLKLLEDEVGREKKVLVQWFVRVSEIPLNKLKLLGREPHPNEVFYYEGTNCDNEVSAESILRLAKVVQVQGSAPFPAGAADADTFFVKLSWTSRSFRVLSEAERSPSPRAASLPPSPLPPSSLRTPPGSALCSPDSASSSPAPPSSPNGPAPPARRRLPTPDPNVLKRASSGVTASAAKRRAQEAESLHSANKMSASKSLSARRRSSAARTPGVRKKLQLFAPEDGRLESELDELLAEDLQTEGVQTLSPPRPVTPVTSVTPRRRPAPLEEEEEEEEEMKMKLPCVKVKRMSLPHDESPSSTRRGSEHSPEQADSEEAELPQSVKTPSKHTPGRSGAPRGQVRTTTPSRKRDAKTLKEPALAVLPEVDNENSPMFPVAPRSSKRKSAQRVSSRIKTQMMTLDLESDSGEEFVPQEEEQSDEEEEEEEEMRRGRRGNVTTPRSAVRTCSRTPRKTPRKVTPSTPKTPRHATPSIPARSAPAKTPANALEEARARLHVSSVPESLPCREQEFQDIYTFVESKILDGTGGCMYISGVPGTGKTATVHEVLRSLQNAADNGEIPTFTFIEINGMKMTDPHQAYVQILQLLSGQKATSDHAASLLEKRFSSPAPRKETTVLLVDELDLLWTRKQNVLYNLFDWPTRRHARLVVLTIANTMDLPERVLLNRVSSRLGLTRLSFQPYSFKQLQQIISSRLHRIRAFEEDALQLVSRKVAALSGDARRCLDICRRATEICELRGGGAGGRLVEISDVMEALGEMFSSAYVNAIRSASVQEQMFLRSIIAEFRRLGLEEATFQQVFVQQVALCRVEGLAPPLVSESLSVCLRLGASRLLLLDDARTDLQLRVRLNVSQDDVLYALKTD